VIKSAESYIGFELKHINMKLAKETKDNNSNYIDVPLRRKPSSYEMFTDLKQ